MGERLRTVFIDRKFPEGYVFGIPETRSPIGDGAIMLVDGAIMLLRSANPDGFHLHVSSLSTNSGAPVFVTDSTTEGSQWQVEFVGSSGSKIFLKNIRSGYYLHIAEESMGDGDTLVHFDSTSEGSQWQVEYVGDSSSEIMLKNIRSGFYLHAEPRSKRACCDEVIQSSDSVTDDSKWFLEQLVQ